MRRKLAARALALAALTAAAMLVSIDESRAGHRGGGGRVVRYNGSRFATSFAGPVKAAPASRPATVLYYRAPESAPVHRTAIPLVPRLDDRAYGAMTMIGD